MNAFATTLGYVMLGYWSAGLVISCIGRVWRHLENRKGGAK